ncbi:MAG: TetR/AcrR family transcriptional regulator [Novosphingobium sp.]
MSAKPDRSQQAPEPVRRRGPGSKPRVDVQARREEYIRIAASVLLEKGIGSTTMQDIADRAGVPKVLFYRIFQSKQALLDAIVDEVLTAFHAAYAQRGKAYGNRVIVLANIARKRPEPYLLVLAYVRAGLDQGQWARIISDTVTQYALERLFVPAPGAPPGAWERAQYAARLWTGPFLDALIAAIENRDGVDDGSRMRWWGQIARQYHLSSREAFQLDAPKTANKGAPDVLIPDGNITVERVVGSG